MSASDRKKIAQKLQKNGFVYKPHSESFDKTDKCIRVYFYEDGTDIRVIRFTDMKSQVISEEHTIDYAMGIDRTVAVINLIAG